MFADLGYFSTVFFLLFGHVLADFALQGNFLAQAKNRNTEVGKAIWPYALFAHAMIHAGFVALVTGSVACGIGELIIHAWIDYRKCDNRLSFQNDQRLHILCKLVWALVVI